MVVGAPDVKDEVDALELVPVVGDVGGEVGVVAVGLLDDAVLVIAERGRLEPQGAVIGGVEVAHLVELVVGALDRRGARPVLLVHRALGHPDVEVAAHVVAGVLHVLEHLLVAALAEGEHALLGVRIDPLVAVGLPEGRGLVDDVGAAIGVLAEVGGELIHVGMRVEVLVGLVLDVVVTVLGEEVAGGVDVAALLVHDVGELHVALGDGVAERVHLVAVIVDPKLALDLVARVLHDVAHGVAQRRPAAMAHVHGADGVGGHELDLGLDAPAHVGLGEVATLLTRHAEDGVVGGGVEIEVDEAGPGDLDVLDLGALGHVRHDGVSDLPRRAMGELSGLHGHRGGPLTMRSVGRSLHTTILKLECGQVASLLSSGQCSTYQLFNLLRHRGPPHRMALRCPSRRAHVQTHCTLAQ